MKQLTPDQLAAIKDYARSHGRSWKSDLNNDWMHGRTTGELQAIRNSFGPSWLVRFSLKKAILAAIPVKTKAQLQADLDKLQKESFDHTMLHYWGFPRLTGAAHEASAAKIRLYEIGIKRLKQQIRDAKD